MLQLLTNFNTKPISRGDRTNPALLVADGTNGEAVVDRLYIHNTDATKFYTNISIAVIDVPVDFTVKLLAQKNQPTAEEWAAASGVTSQPDIGSLQHSDVDFHPFWIYFQVPRGTQAQTALAGMRIFYAESLAE